MDASSNENLPSEISMGRPSDESIEEEGDVRKFKDLIVSKESGNAQNRMGQSFQIVENWLEHESERLRPIHITLSESSDALSVRADVPGVKGEDLKIKVEPARVMITRRPATKRVRTIYSASCSDEGIQVIDLPNPVIVDKVRIAIRDGVLELDLAKADRTNLKAAGPKTS
jgi:HSP20 family molecular chaperone IbpA